MKLAIEAIEIGNQRRISDRREGVEPAPLQITDEMMAYSQYRANHQKIESGHNSDKQGRGYENISGYAAYDPSNSQETDPYIQWFDDEKKLYDEVQASGEYGDLNKLTVNQIVAKYEDLYGRIGHYLNLVSPSAKITGYASYGFQTDPNNPNGWSRGASVQNMSNRLKQGEVPYSVSEYKARFMKYYNELKDAKENGSKEARGALAKAEADAGLQEKLAKQAQAAKDLEQAKATAAEQAKKCADCQKALEEAEAALEKANAAVPTAEEALTTAKEATAAQENVVADKEKALQDAKDAQEAADQAVNQAQTEVDAKQQAADDAQQAVDEKQKALDAAKENYDAVVATKADAKKQLEDAENAVKQAEDALNAAKAEKDKADAAVTDAGTKLNEAQQQAAEATDKETAAKAAKEKADKDAADAKTANDTAAKDYADKAAAQKAADNAKAKADAADKAVTDAQEAKEKADQEVADANTAKDTAQKAQDQAAVDNKTAQEVPDLDTWVKDQPETNPAPAPVAPLRMMALRAPAATSVSAETQQAIDDVLAKYQAYLEAAQAAGTATEKVQQLAAAYKEAKAALAPFEAALQQANTQLDKAKASYEKLYQDCIAPGSAATGKHAQEQGNASSSGLGQTGVADLSTILGLSAISAGAGAYLVARRRQPKHAH